MHKEESKNFECPKLGKMVKLKFTPVDPVPDSNLPIPVKDCDGAIECGVAKHMYTSIDYDWSMCPYQTGEG